MSKLSTILAEKVAEDNYTEVQSLLLNNTPAVRAVAVNELDDSGFNSLLHAVDGKNPAMVHLLLVHGGADPNIKCSDGRTALHNVTMVGDGGTQTAKILLSHGADVNALEDRNEETPLHYAIVYSSFEIAKLLLAYGADVNAPDEKNKETPLHYAARFFDCNTFTVRDCGKKINISNTNLTGTKLLIRKGADINALNHTGDTALHLASKNGSFECVELLLNHGAHVNLKNQEGVTALNCAETANETQVAELLRKFGAS